MGKYKLLSLFLLFALIFAMGGTYALAATPYTVSLPAHTEIYKGPGSDSGFASYVGENGIYTIVEEAADEYGALWGRLKSGAGWVRLSAALSKPLEIAYADPFLMNSGNYTAYIMSSSDWAVDIALKAKEQLSYISLLEMEPDMRQPRCEIFRLAKLGSDDSPFVLHLEFAGDLSSYGLHFLGEGNEEHLWVFYQSGKDGSLIVEDISEILG